MVLDKETMKAYNRDAMMCWECYNCVKICPTQAVQIRGYADFVPLGTSVVPLRSHGFHHVDRAIPERHSEALQIPYSSTPEGTAVPNGGFDSAADLSSSALFTEPASLGLPEVFSLGKGGSNA